MNLFKISWFPDFIQYFPDFSQRFPDFSLTKFFKVRKCERCGSLNPRLDFQSVIFFWDTLYMLCHLLSTIIFLKTVKPLIQMMVYTFNVFLINLYKRWNVQFYVLYLTINSVYLSWMWSKKFRMTWQWF